MVALRVLSWNRVWSELAEIQTLREAA